MEDWQNYFLWVGVGRGSFFIPFISSRTKDFVPQLYLNGGENLEVIYKLNWLVFLSLVSSPGMTTWITQLQE